MKSLCHFPILIVVCFPALVGCNKESIDLNLLQEQVEALHARCDKAERVSGELRKDLRTVRENQEEVSLALNQLRKTREEVQRQIEAMTEAFGSYRSTYRESIRKQAKGMTFPLLEMEGRRFVNVVIRELSDSEMTFQHRDGISRVESQKLPGDMKDLFVIDGSLPAEVAEVAAIQLSPLPSFLGLVPGMDVPAPLVAPLMPAATGAQSDCPPCIAAPQTVGRVPTGYRAVGSSFQGSYYKTNKTTVGFQGTR